MTLAKDTEKVFQCGISVAPVTNWWFYDSIYTERYMGLPNATFNELNYKAGDVANAAHIEQIGKHDFFLIHGNGDDNVHYQQSMVLARALEMADIMFEQLVITKKKHNKYQNTVTMPFIETLIYYCDLCFNVCFIINSFKNIDCLTNLITTTFLLNEARTVF